MNPLAIEPRPSTEASYVSPSRSDLGGSAAMPTPEGVPVSTMSPGSIVITVVM